MRPRPTLTAGIVLATTALTAATTVGLGASPANAAHHQHGSRSGATASAAVTPDITVTGTKSSLALSVSTHTPGNTVFDVHSPGSIELVSFKPGYSISDLAKDGKKLFSGDVKVVRRVDKKAILWGGLAKNGEFAVNLPAGSYYVVNLDKDLVAPLTVAGAPAVRALPAVSGKVKMVGSMTFKADATLPKDGWISMQNKASEPHFIDFSKVKKGTTAAQVRRFLLGGAQGQPSFSLAEDHEALVVSPGHTFEYLMDATKGEYVELCFWPSKKTGMPHALMGMFDISTLK